MNDNERTELINFFNESFDLLDKNYDNVLKEIKSGSSIKDIPDIYYTELVIMEALQNNSENFHYLENYIGDHTYRNIVYHICERAISLTSSTPIKDYAFYPKLLPYIMEIIDSPYDMIKLFRYEGEFQYSCYIDTLLMIYGLLTFNDLPNNIIHYIESKKIDWDSKLNWITKKAFNQRLKSHKNYSNSAYILARIKNE